MKKNLLFPLIILILCSCSKKYAKYNVIEKKTFEQTKSEPTKYPLMTKGRKNTETFCKGQIFFSSNAEKITESSLNSLIRQSCPGQDYLIDVNITRIWWTLLVYSRSCIEVQSFCPGRVRARQE